MSKEKIENIISKYINHEASEAEIEELLVWLEDPKNEKAFKENIAVSHYLNKSFKKFDSAKAYKNTLQIYKTSKKKKRISAYFAYAVAASLVLLISLTIIFNKDNNTVINDSSVVNNITQGTDKATLTLEDGTDIILEKGQDYVANNVISNGEELVYNSNANSKTEIVYNYLTVPRGGQYMVKLSDGTQVWLNSESKLKYPVNFVANADREVELLYGEAYFDVSPSENHNGSVFKVYSQQQEINVLGTEFNVKSYKDEDIIQTTLVEGKITLDVSTFKNILNPAEQLTFNTTNKSINKKVVDVKRYVSWKDGYFTFEDKSLEEVCKIMSRWYDVDFEISNSEIKNIELSGSVRKNQNIENILMSLYNLKDIQYEIKENKKVYLK
ncbi:FecR family protein [Flavivirga eckloniae]|uniref:Anti-sigma factor n=1 Tax=Flavivirga eckloniae TaxID=1803846 RepID=A0A2K9PSE0_9FLAO|nr:FecR family protein [Flavivirga eckloniae]AUP79975.1 hypothetical protein C1H87_15200 [Flavivirga eckloniae]